MNCAKTVQTANPKCKDGFTFVVQPGDAAVLDTRLMF